MDKKLQNILYEYDSIGEMNQEIVFYLIGKIMGINSNTLLTSPDDSIFRHIDKLFKIISRKYDSCNNNEKKEKLSIKNSKSNNK